MSTYITSALQSAKTKINDVLNEQNKWTRYSSYICLSVGAEAILRAAGELTRGSSLSTYAISGNIATCISFTACGCNIFSGAARCGALGFWIFSMITGQSGPYVTSKGISFLTKKAFKHVASPIFEHAICPIGKHVFLPIVERICKVVSFILKNIRLPEHPMWLVVASIGGIFATYKIGSFVLNSIKNSLNQ